MGEDVPRSAGAHFDLSESCHKIGAINLQSTSLPSRQVL